MYLLLLTSWLCLPLAPLNPIEEDTLASINLHFAAGVSGPNGIVSTGPEISARYEMLVLHPLFVRGGIDYRYAKMNSGLHPKGNLHTTTLSLETLYYRGTDHLTGYIGGGIVYTFNWFNLTTAAADSLWTNESVTNVDVNPQTGYRITFGLRYHQSYSLEVSVTELRPDIVKRSTTGRTNFYEEYRETRTGSFRITLGYLLPLARF